jgi:hypothetical protein
MAYFQFLGQKIDFFYDFFEKVLELEKFAQKFADMVLMFKP